MLILTIIFITLITWIYFRKSTSTIQEVKSPDKSYKSINKATKIKIPRIQSWLLRIIVSLCRARIGGSIILSFYQRITGFTFFRNIRFHETPTILPNLLFRPLLAKISSRKHIASQEESKPHHCFTSLTSPFVSITNLTNCYKSNLKTPTQVARDIITQMKKYSNMNAVVKSNSDDVLEMAAASTERYLAGKTLSPLDGVFVAIKDEFKVDGYTCSSGTSYLKLGSNESCLIAKLRSLGCIFVGISNMHEIGIGTTGLNPNKGWGPCRNPYEPNFATGGSSSGSAASVAMGICNFAIGTDGGGSIRIPAANCGVVGLKATFGRFSLGLSKCSSFSLSHAGPICNNVKDAILVYQLLAGPCPYYDIGFDQPEISLKSRDIKTMKICFDSRWLKDCDDDVMQATYEIMTMLKDSVASIDDVKISEIFQTSIAHSIIFISEAFNALHETDIDKLSLPSLTKICIGEGITSSDYSKACQQRTRALYHVMEVFGDYDVIIAPSTGCTAVKINEEEIRRGGYIDVLEMRKLMNFSVLANMTGIPSISIPVGYSCQSNLPFGIQLMTKWWNESDAFELAKFIESKIKIKKPKVFFDMIEGA